MTSQFDKSNGEATALKRALVKSEDGHEFLNQGNLGQARSSLELSVSIRVEQLAKQCDTLASLHITEGNYDGALKEYDYSLTILKQHSSSSSLSSQRLLAKCLANIGRVKEKLEDWQGAINHYRQALDVYQRLQPVSKQVADLHKTIARILLSETNDEKGALHELTLARDVRQKQQANQAEIISLLDDDNGDDVDVVHSDEAKTNARRVSFEPDDTLHGSQESPPQSMTSVQEVVDSTSPLHGTTVNEMTNSQRIDNGSGKGYAPENRNTSDQGRVDDGTVQEPSSVKDTLTPSPSTPSPITRPSSDTVNKGEELLEQGHLEGALEQFQRALAGYNLSEQPDLLAIATTHSKIGLILSEQGHYDEAETEYRRALGIREEESPNSVLVASSCEDIAGLLDTMKDYSGSLRFWERAISITRRLGPLDRDLAMLYFLAGRVHENRCDPHAALCKYRMAAEIVEKVEPQSLDLAKDLADIHLAIGDVLKEQGDSKAAIESFERALVIYEQHGFSSTVEDSIRDQIRILSSVDTEMVTTDELDANESRPDCETAASDWLQEDIEDGKEMVVECSGTAPLVAAIGSKRNRTTVSDGITHDDDDDEGEENAIVPTTEFISEESGKKRARLSKARFSPKHSSQAPSAGNWTEKEEKTLRTKRQIGMSYGQIAKILPRRTKDAVAKRCRTFGIVVTSNVAQPSQASSAKNWTEEEEETLRAKRQLGMSYEQIAKILPGRTNHAVGNRCRLLGIGITSNVTQPPAREATNSNAVGSHGRKLGIATAHDEEEDNVIAQTIEDISEEPVKKRVRRFTDRFSPEHSSPASSKNKTWTEEEEKTLRAKRQLGMSYEQIAEILPGRSHDAVGNRCRLLGIGITSNATQPPARELTNSSPEAATTASQPTRPRMTKESTSILRRGLAQGLSYDKIAERLPNRSRGACERKHVRLSQKLKTAPPPRPSKRAPSEYTAGMNAIIKKAREVDGLAWDEIAKLLPADSEKSGNAVRQHYHKVLKERTQRGQECQSNCEKAPRFPAEDARLVRQSRLSSFSRPRSFT